MVLCCMTLHCVAWRWLALHCIAWCGLTWRCMMWYGVAWHWCALVWVAWYCMMLHDMALHCIQCISCHSISLHCMAWCGIALYGLAWHAMVVHGFAWCCMALTGTEFYCMTWRDTVMVLYCKALHSNEWRCIAWCVIALHGMAWYGVAWHRGHDVEWYGNGLHCIACMALHYMSWCGIAWHGLLYWSYMNTAAEIHVLGCFLEERLPCYIWHSLLPSQAWIHMSCDSICARVKLSITETVTSIMTTVWIKSDIPISNCVYYIITLLEGFQKIFVDRETGLAGVSGILFRGTCFEHPLQVYNLDGLRPLGKHYQCFSGTVWQALRESKKLYRK